MHYEEGGSPPNKRGDDTLQDSIDIAEDQISDLKDILRIYKTRLLISISAASLLLSVLVYSFYFFNFARDYSGFLTAIVNTLAVIFVVYLFENSRVVMHSIETTMKINGHIRKHERAVLIAREELGEAKRG